MGVIDEVYLQFANDPSAKLGHKVILTAQEVSDTSEVILALSQYITSQLSIMKP
jgi:hypothetical protein